MEWDRTEKYKEQSKVDMDVLTKRILTILAIEHDVTYAPVYSFTIVKAYLDRYRCGIPYKELGFTKFRDFLLDIPMIEEDKELTMHFCLSQEYWQSMGKKLLPPRFEPTELEENLKNLRAEEQKLLEWDLEEWDRWTRMKKPTLTKEDSTPLDKVNEWLEKATIEEKPAPFNTKFPIEVQQESPSNSPDNENDDNWTVISGNVPSHTSSTSPFSLISKKTSKSRESPAGEPKVVQYKAIVGRLW